MFFLSALLANKKTKRSALPRERRGFFAFKFQAQGVQYDVMFYLNFPWMRSLNFRFLWETPKAEPAVTLGRQRHKEQYMKTITLSKFKELVECEDWAHSQTVFEIEERERVEEHEDGPETVIPGGYGTVQKNSVLNGITITYDEHYEFDDSEPRSLKVHAAGDYEWSIEGVEVVADDNIANEEAEALDTLELIEYLPAEFSEIDYAFLEPKFKQITDAVDGAVDADNEIFTIPVNNSPDIRFVGKKIAETSSSKHRASEFYSGKTGRWTELHLYKTKGGKYVCQQIGRTEWIGEYDRYSA